MSADIRIGDVAELGSPLGQYSHLTRVRSGELVFIAGMLSTNRAGEVVGAGDFAAQCGQVFANVETALRSVGADWSAVVQFTTYLVHSLNIPDLMTFRTREFPRMFPSGVYPPNTLLVIDQLVDERFLVEIQTVAAL